MTTSQRTVLCVDDDQSNLSSLEKILHKEGYRVLTAPGGEVALELLRRHPVEVIVTDLMMPGMSGMDLLRAARTIAPSSEVVVMTAYGTVEAAVDAMKEGAYDFVEKPLKRAQIVRTVLKAGEKQSLVQENRDLKTRLEHLEKAGGGGVIIGNSPALRRTLEVALTAAPSSATVLVLGESGTGKELLARRIHERSGRADHAFVAVNCAAIPETILEAELFGYERGAFTGAVVRREGRFAQADGGTLFLDEVAELSGAVQVKLLRVLSDGQFEPLGGRTVHADIRLIAATNKDLEAEVKAGRFREDLYYRLNVIAITSPPLRDRRDDVPLLADHFLRLYGAKNGKSIAGFSEEAMRLLVDYHWPGNVRELENTVERSVVLSKGSVIGREDLPPSVASAASTRATADLVISVGTPLDEIERRVIRETLKRTQGDKRLAAQLLGIATRTIYRKLADEAGGPGAEPPMGAEEPAPAAAPAELLKVG